MVPCLLVWALPGEWDAYDLDDSDVAEDLLGTLRARWSSFHLDEAAEEILFWGPVRALQQAREAGTLLWAIRATGDGTAESPLSTVSLSIALADLIPDRAMKSNGNQGAEAPTTFRNRAKSLPLDRSMTGFVIEERMTAFDGVSLYSAQIFVTSPPVPAVAVVSVTTADPARENEAREAASFVARSMHFLTMEDS